MRQRGPKAVYTVENPNTPHEVREMLKAILIEKLSAVKREGARRQNEPAADP